LNTDKTPFDRETALHALPRAAPPIRVLLTFAGGDDLPEAFQWIVDGLCADLDAAAKSTATLHTAGMQDPLINFYEPFLAAYDPHLRERAGVYYTPDPVVDFLVRAVDDLLKCDFGKESGLADPSVRLLDPATGTATFLARAYRQVHQTMLASGDGGLWPDRARSHVAQHFYGFERLPAAYTLAHVKLRQQLREMGVVLGDTDRLPVFLADTMMNKVPAQLSLPGANILSKEIRDAAQVRDQEEILVILGNPPYFGKSDNPSKDSLGHLTFIGELMQEYYQVDGVPLGEKNPKWLQNDYVKFLRFAQWRIARSGQGIVAFITDNSYLDNPTFRGMRRSLMETFDEIYILDLHGNSKKRERDPSGGKNENVFDITQGVALCVMVKLPSSPMV
jgi:predicted helicase